MDDKTTIQNSYASVLDNLFKQLFDGFTESAGSAPMEAQVLASFTSGLAIARRARDAAIAAL